MVDDATLTTLMREATSGRLTRRDVLRRAAALGLGAPAIASLLAACGGGNAPASTTVSGTAPGGSANASPAGGATRAAGSAGASPSAAQGTRGGILKVALVGEPPTLDEHQTTGTVVALIGWPMYETLFSWDANFNLIPMLAAAHDISSDGLTHTVRLRQHVPFHNGQEMKSSDVTASIKHWATQSGLGKSLLAVTDTMTETDDYTVEFKLKQPYGVFAASLSVINQGCAIYPKTVIDAAGSGPLKDFIGTGPYKFVEHQPDRLIRLARFDNYAALPGDANGYGGHKYAYIDEIQYIPVPDEAARIAGLRAGDYHYPESITPDQYDSLKSDPNIAASVLPPLSWGVFILNLRQGPLSNLKLRQAFQAALDHNAIAAAGYGQGFYRLDPGLMMKETVWYTDAGKENYNPHDPNKAKQLLQEAGYDGTPIRFTCTQQYQDHYERTVVAKQQLEVVGFKVDLRVYDWATVLTQQQQADKWDATTTGITFRPDPTLMAIMDVCNFAGWWCNDDTVNLVQQLRSEADFKKRYALWQQVQTNYYTEIPEIKVADALQAFVRSKKLQGLSEQNQLGPILWNAWLSK